MRKPWILPGVAVAGGVVGLLVRRVYLASAFEPGTGLPISGAPITGVMWAVLLVTALAAFLLSRGKHRTFEGCYTAAFSSTSFVQLTGNLAAAVLLLVGGFCNIEAYLTTYNDMGFRTLGIARLVLGVLCLLSAAGIYFTAQKMRQRKEVRSCWLLAPGFTGCLWVMANYQTWAQDPVLGNYLVSLLAVLLSMLACYLLAGFAFGKGQVTGTLFVSTVAAAFAIMVLADGLPLYDLAIYLGMVFYLLSMAAALAVNDHKPVVADVPACGGSCQGCTGCGPAPAAEEESSQPGEQ